jgi:hypothetical protein
MNTATQNTARVAKRVAPSFKLFVKFPTRARPPTTVATTPTNKTAVSRSNLVFSSSPASAAGLAPVFPLITCSPMSPASFNNRPPVTADALITPAMIKGLCCFLLLPSGAKGTSPVSTNRRRPASPPEKPPVRVESLPVVLITTASLLAGS